MTGAAQPQAAPDVVAIRARPPSPKRLSRKVLLAGALVVGAIVAVALTFGLSERPGRARAADPRANASTAGPPETIRLAPPGYDAALMDGGAFDEAAVDAAPSESADPRSGPAGAPLAARPIWSHR